MKAEKYTDILLKRTANIKGFWERAFFMEGVRAVAAADDEVTLKEYDDMVGIICKLRDEVAETNK